MSSWQVSCNKAIKYVPATKNVASTGLPTRCFCIRLWRCYAHNGDYKVRSFKTIQDRHYIDKCKDTPKIENGTQDIQT